MQRFPLRAWAGPLLAALWIAASTIPAARADEKEGKPPTTERKAAKERSKAAKEQAEEREEEAERQAKLQRKQAKLVQKELDEFEERAVKYMDIHEDVEKSLGGVPPRDADPATVNEFTRRLALGIRARRAGAKQGDIFTPRLREAFLRIFRERLVGRDGAAERRVILQEGNPLSDEDDRQRVPLVINGNYPLGAPLSTVPATLLQVLPVLPEELRFRFVGSTLILRDAEANIIVDYLPHAVP